MHVSLDGSLLRTTLLSGTLCHEIGTSSAHKESKFVSGKPGAIAVLPKLPHDMIACGLLAIASDMLLAACGGTRILFELCILRHD